MVSTGERVRRAALRLFYSRGFEGTGIRKIAEQAGISVASLYHYVGTKEDLLEQIMLESMTDLLTPAQALAEAVSEPGERIADLVALHVQRHAQHRQLCLVGDTEIRSLSPGRRARVMALRDAYQAIWEQAIASGVEAGEIAVPDVKLATFALLQMCTGVAHWYTPRGRLSLDEISAAFVTMARALLSSGARQDGSPPASGPPLRLQAGAGAQ
jgi:TetR/AcrR family transcriptional regulator, cholesterol catabolism regulator